MKAREALLKVRYTSNQRDAYDENYGLFNVLVKGLTLLVSASQLFGQNVFIYTYLTDNK